ncbi:hypothetical protein BDV33DRAFT_136647 [Aspergillus novoparasiticus]|uniref:Uncharacterized protein n=1 Tax=Aspergillus novoparasiticus TaxID=986946 RepID=A0A5N6F528_9EURO|nr:hypothetical protein BDV33DRAFT_136647 [Aspergillus novoparasiticus]
MITRSRHFDYRDLMLYSVYPHWRHNCLAFFCYFTCYFSSGSWYCLADWRDGCCRLKNRRCFRRIL